MPKDIMSYFLQSVIKLRIWGRDYSRLSEWVPNAIIGVLPPPSFVEVRLTNKNCLYLGCTTQRVLFKTYNVVIQYVHSEMITTIKLINTSIISHQLPFVKCGENIYIYSISSFQIYNPALLTIVTIVYIRSLELITKRLWPTSPPFLLPSSPWKSPFYSLVLHVQFYRFHKEVQSCKICHSESDLFHLA